MLKKLREKCAFTLVELIVVLVILAILAALLVPALTGYIDKSRKSQVIAETRALHEAIQTEMVELYGSNAPDTFSNTNFATIVSGTGNLYSGNLASNADILKSRYNQIVSLSEVPSLNDGTGTFLCVVDPSGKVHFIIYGNGKGYVGIYLRESQEYMALRTSDEAPNAYAYYLNPYKNIVVSCAVSSDHPDEITVVWSRRVILYTIGYQDINP